MANAIQNQPHFQDAEKAREYLEALRWPHGPVCPHCGVVGTAYKLEGTSHRPGLYKCKDCREQFTVTVGTLFERSKIALNVWLQAVHLMCASKKGISAKQLERMLGVTYKTAWFMAHRIREAMTSDPKKGPHDVSIWGWPDPAWLQIFLEPAAYPPPDTHPLSLIWKERKTRHRPSLG